MMILLVLGVMFGACGGGGASTPEAAFESLKSAALNKDGGALYDMMAPSEVARAEKEWEDAKNSADRSTGMAQMLGVSVEELKAMSFRDMFVRMADKQESTEEISLELVETTVDGDKATLKIKSTKGVDSVSLVKEDGKWYLASVGMGL
jgi:hypothetical protein